jgi:hypothetical protein
MRPGLTSGCPEPKPIFIALLATAGALGIFGGTLLQDLVRSRPTDWTPIVVLRQLSVGFLLGAAIATSLALTVRPWLRIVLSWPLGFGGYLAGWMAVERVSTGTADISPILLIGALACGTLPVGLMTTAHVLHQGHRDSGVLVWMLVFLTAGALSSLFEPIHSYRSGFSVGLQLTWYKPIGGLAFGLLQFLALSAALALDRRMKRLVLSAS